MRTAADRVTTASDPLREVRDHGTASILAGAVSVLAGICAIVYPEITLLALAIFTGINLIVLSAVRILDAFSEGLDTTTRTLSGVLGMLGLIAGLVVLRRPGETLLALVVVVGIWLVVTGVVDFIRAMSDLEDRALRMLGALADIVLGVLVLSLPGVSLATFAVLVGIAFVVRGVLFVGAGWRTRRGAGTAPLGAHA